MTKSSANKTAAKVYDETSITTTREGPLGMDLVELYFDLLTLYGEKLSLMS